MASSSTLMTRSAFAATRQPFSRVWRTCRRGMTQASGNIPQVENAITKCDLAISAFAASTGLQCPPDCGRCCHSPEVEATPSELTPLARELVASGEGLAWLHVLEDVTASASSSRCVFFQPGVTEGSGRCGVYAHRPATCRVFGFTGRLDSQGRAEFSGCKHMNQRVVQDAADAVRVGRIAMPIAAEHARAIHSEADPLDAEPMNINVAALQALRRELFRSQMRQAAVEDGNVV